MLKWVDKKKALQWLSNNSSYVNSVGLSSKRISKIITNFQNPTIEEGKIISEVQNISESLNTTIKIIKDLMYIQSINQNGEFIYTPK